jgi:DNA-binding XRE family transcriptional regulator
LSKERKYWVAPAGDGTFLVGTGDDDAFAKVWSEEVATKIADALNALEKDDGAAPQKFAVVNRVREWRLRRNLTQAQLADLIDVSQGTITRYETAKIGLDLEMLERLANALQVAPALLIDNHGEQQ